MTNLSNWDATAKENAKKGFRIHLLVFVLVTPAIWLIWYFSGKAYPWPLWSTPAWGIGLLFHYLGVFVFKKRTS
ncbi:2TM domain-containing protein [Dyadobacter sp. OTU695]|uniref:2TM domain-containing protein n=1 Tax=Dyadobacter sp. OTU695 TaxID=3043860 RepID=UPI00406C18F5